MAKAKAAATYFDERVNTTFIGYLIIAIFLLMVGIFGLQDGNLFGDDPTKWPLSTWVFMDISFVVGVIFLILTVFAYRTGEKTSAALFAISALTAFIIYYNLYEGGYWDNVNWFIYIIVAIMFVILALYTLLDDDAKLVALLFIVIAAVFVFVALAAFFIPETAYSFAGPGDNVDLYHSMNIVSGVIAFVGFVLATYISLAYAQPDKLPLI